MITKKFAVTNLINGKTKVMDEAKAIKFLMKHEGFLECEAFAILSRVNCLTAVESDEILIEKIA
jgi:hypothetical protein